MNTRHRIILLGGAALAAVSLSAGLSVPTASAVPGQCWNSPFGGFCDTAPQADGSYQNCITFGSSSYCQQVCHNPVTNQAVPTDYNFTTPC
jgi:hypothetical protein